MSSKFYEKQWFMWIMLIFLAPVGIYLLWKYNRFSKNTRKIIAVVFGVFWIFAMIGAQSDRKEREAFNKQQSELKQIEKENQQKKVQENKELESKKKAEEEAKKQEELNNRNIEQIAADTAKKMVNNRFIEVGYEDDKKTKLVLTIGMADNLTNNLIRRGMILDAEKIIRELCKYEKFKALNNFTIVHTSEFIDAYGNKKVDNSGIISLAMSDINKINWENFITDNLPKIAKSYYVHPALFK
jgi:hypothetical protein